MWRCRNTGGLRLVPGLHWFEGTGVPLGRGWVLPPNSFGILAWCIKKATKGDSQSMCKYVSMFPSLPGHSLTHSVTHS